MRSPTRILIIGFGDVGGRVAKRLVDRYAVSALVRDAEGVRRAHALGVHVVRGDLCRADSLPALAGQSDVVFHFAPPPTEGIRDNHTRNLLAALAQSPKGKSTRSGMLSQPTVSLPRRLVYVSTTGVYGDCGGAWIDETRTLNPSTSRARRRVDAERTLRAWGRRTGVVVSILRVPGIYSEVRLPVDRLRNRTPALIAEDDVFTNHVHADDLARAAVAAMRFGKPGRIYNVVDNSTLRMGEYFDSIADAYGLPRPPRLSRTDAAKQLSPTMLSFMNESRRIRNERVKRELRLALRYPTIEDFLRAE